MFASRRELIGGVAVSGGNVISVLARGNRELFHSSVIAWLLDETGSHGLGREFLGGVLDRLPFGPRYAGLRLEVTTETVNGQGRYDILLREHGNDNAGLVLENKTKSLGSHSQLDHYAATGVDVALLAMIPQVFDDESRQAWPMITYRDIHRILGDIVLDPSDGYQFIVGQYREYLDGLLRPYEVLSELAIGGQAAKDDTKLVADLQSALRQAQLGSNDWRTLGHFYLVSLREYLHQCAPDLVFGDKTYGASEEAGENMAWHVEKNMRSKPFMEAVLYHPERLPEPWRLRADIAPLMVGSHVIPRVELWGMERLLSGEADAETQVGWCVLGISDGVPDDLWTFMKTTEPYSSRLNGGQRRNFHIAPVRVEDLAFERMTEIIRTCLAYIYERT